MGAKRLAGGGVNPITKEQVVAPEAYATLCACGDDDCRPL